MLMSVRRQKKTRKYDRQQSFDMLADVAKLLMVLHKDLSQHRREALRPSVNRDYHISCNRTLYATLKSSEFLFREDMAKRAGVGFKTRRLTC